MSLLRNALMMRLAIILACASIIAVGFMPIRAALAAGWYATSRLLK